ncbi:Uncharactierzed protein [Aromatoleum bremense]|nr:Uncharactierzed protein [Aromatoleum bremense]
MRRSDESRPGRGSIAMKSGAGISGMPAAGGERAWKVVALAIVVALFDEGLPVLLASADCHHLVIQKRGAADAVLPSKLTNILAAGGNAVITADADTTLGVLCSEREGHQLGKSACSRATIALNSMLCRYFNAFLRHAY